MSEQEPDASQTDRLSQSAGRFTIGLLTTGDFMRFAPDHWLGVVDAAQEQDVNVVCFQGEALHAPQRYYDPFLPSAEIRPVLDAPDGTHRPASAIFGLIGPEAIDGLIIWSSALNWFVGLEEIENFCKRYPLPVVSAEVPFADIPSVLIDDYGGMYDVISHLIEAHGYRRIAFLRGFENHYGMHERYRGYTAALIDHDLTLDPNLVIPAVSSDGRTELKVLLDERGLQPKIDFDAVVGWSGGTVAGIHALFEERGIQVPGDVAVVGFDNPVELGMYMPPYTVVDPQVYEVGRRAVEQMLAVLRGEDVPERITVPARVIVRRSCGCQDRAVIAVGAETPRMSPMALPAQRSASEALEGVISVRRGELLAEITEASGVAPEQAAEFLEAFSASLKAAASEPFLSRLELLLHQSIATGADPTIWHSALSTLRRALPLFDDIGLLSQIEDVWQQGHVLTGKTARRAQAYQTMRAEQQSLMLREIESALLNTYDMRELADVLVRSLLHLGIPSAYLAVYEHPQPYEQQQSPSEWSRLILACDERGQASFDAEGQRFRSRQLTPEGLVPHERRYSLVAEPLYFRTHNLGFVLFEIGPRQGLVYETLREGISYALYGDWLLRERQQAGEVLQQRAVGLELHQREQSRRLMLERVVRAGKAMTQTAELRTCLLHIRNSIQRELDFDRVGLFLYDAERNVISGSYGTDRAGKLTEEWDNVIPMPVDAPYRILLIQQNSFLFTDDYEAKYNPPPGHIMAGVKQHAAVGVWADNRPFAILVVDNLLTQRPMTEEQLEALRLSAGYAGLAIENTRLLEQARQAEQKYRSIFENSMEGIAQITAEGLFLSANPALAQIYGYSSPEEMLASPTNIHSEVFVDPARRAELDRLLEEQGEVHDFEYQIRRKDGHLAWVSLNARLVHRGQRPYFEGTLQDITERRKLEAQLLMAQKMEAIGQLAGGIAHDFNNLLVVISGNADFASAALPPDDPIQADLREIQGAAARATNLTRQLLTFARRQVTAPQILNLNDLLLDIDKLLRRLIREDILLQTSPAPDLWLVRADSGQIEQVIINLAVNARDAMPQGGRLMIETANVVLDQEYTRTHPTVSPGPYLLLAVTDTGAGMSAEVLRHAFEPFFTTKEPGHGTGLGLATCYGIVSQHGGSIQLYSEVGQGTSVKVYLPRTQGAVLAPLTQWEADQIPRGTETVLLVEDEAAVRVLTARTLRTQGYTVLEAANGIEALDIVDRHTGAPIDLLLTDMIMPRMAGHELAEKLRHRIPNIRVMFMSGYTDNAVIQNGLLDPSITFIQKPFTLSALGHSIRAVLDQ